MNRGFVERGSLAQLGKQATATQRYGQAARNETLRRADWRFLLPNPTPGRVLCLASGLLKEAVSQIALETMELAGAESCELAVAVDPSRADLESAWDALAPGGTLYTEWTVPLITLGQIRNELSAGDFESTALYWAYPFPSVAPAAIWLPIDSPNALHYAASLPQTLKNRVMRTGWSLLARLGWAMPVSAIARKPIQSTEQIRQSHAWGWGGWPEDWAWLLLTPGLRSNNKAVMLGFDPESVKPKVALKYARVREVIPALRQERENLNALEMRTHGELYGVPAVLSYQERGETAALGETILSGAPLYQGLSRRTFEPLARTATEWLIEFAHATAVPARESDFQGRIVEPVFADFVKNYGEVADPDLVRSAGEMLAKLNPRELIFEHRDFSPWNLLLDSAKKAVVLDWESAEPRGIPGLDLIYFLAYLAFFQNDVFRTGRFVETYRALLDPNTFFGKVFAECTARYAARVGMDPSDWHALRVLTWMLHGRSEYARECADSKGKPDAAQLGQSLFLQLVKEELRQIRHIESDRARNATPRRS